MELISTDADIEAWILEHWPSWGGWGLVVLLSRAPARGALTKSLCKGIHSVEKTTEHQLPLLSTHHCQSALS